MFAQAAEVIKEVDHAFKETAQTFGLAVTILVVVLVVLAGTVGFALWRLCRWGKPYVEAMAAGHLNMMKDSGTAMNRMADSQESQATSMDTLADSQKMQAESMGKIAESDSQQQLQMQGLVAETKRTNEILERGKCMAAPCQAVSADKLTEIVAAAIAKVVPTRRG